MDRSDDDERAEFARLDALLTELHPRHGATRRAAAPAADVPRRLAALWQGIGVSEVTVAPGTRTSTGTAESRRIMTEVFEEWFDDAERRDRWGVEADDHGPAWARLGRRFRVLAARGPRSELAAVLDEVAVTDESAGQDDPPVVVVRSDGRPVHRWHGSAVEWQIWHILQRAALHRSARFDPRCGLTGEPVLPSVYPWLEVLGDGVWRLSEPGPARQDVRPALPELLVFRSPAHYFALARSVDDATLARLHPPGPGRLIVTAAVLDLDGTDVRRVPRDRRTPFDRTVEAIGRIDGADVWIESLGDQAVLHCDPRHRTAVGQELTRLGGRVIRDETREGWQQAW
ncbi:hypothetical protein OG871_01205 [Kitasatospora sp. NBC_00374]|uniref:hypothetical protein n=1 Tax=Kitasatospora sp. NBC_00374 TaxID=2975964 RepID=UPI0030E144D6